MSKGVYQADEKINAGLEHGKWYFYFMQTVFGPYEDKNVADAFYEDVTHSVHAARSGCASGNCED